ncbi:hypothetical protein FD04_GL001199 [Secundilactobacillus odoratitofui DSM 19909 = JCM 15043]|uniref:Lipopolysaccharide assembly protein A domain-containing protein n=1 Tax=Secundilactobacillus odoratitofui DSM 19909 = JCM 15043 TaxID=1423776 RepID=A0A0R1LQU7_9LACO|nr:LapA family protein [Secundilactobacillus odoratitofui]KRK98220.1 hypothetical protein FD04_GL001199 [Secundilactobacillus odoratitofui DSM 19909 = JCM 15043]
MKRQGKVILAIILVIVIAVFSVLNTTSVPIHFGFATVSWPLVLILLVAVFVGALLMFLFSTIGNYQSKKVIKTQATKIQTLERRLTHLSQTDSSTTPTKAKDDKRD